MVDRQLDIILVWSSGEVGTGNTVHTLTTPKFVFKAVRLDRDPESKWRWRRDQHPSPKISHVEERQV